MVRHSPVAARAASGGKNRSCSAAARSFGRGSLAARKSRSPSRAERGSDGEPSRDPRIDHAQRARRRRTSSPTARSGRRRTSASDRSLRRVEPLAEAVSCRPDAPTPRKSNRTVGDAAPGRLRTARRSRSLASVPPMSGGDARARRRPTFDRHVDLASVTGSRSSTVVSRPRGGRYRPHGAATRASARPTTRQVRPELATRSSRSRCSTIGCWCRSRREEGERRTSGGILIPATAQMSKRLVWAEVVAAGAERPQPSRSATRCCSARRTATRSRCGGEDYMILRERDIHAVAAASQRARRASTSDGLRFACPPTMCAMPTGTRIAPPTSSSPRSSTTPTVSCPPSSRTPAPHEVLMMAWMNDETLRDDARGGPHGLLVSRSRQEVWRKGDTSGDRQFVREAYYDCDGDTLLFVVEQEGEGACHTGAAAASSGRSAELSRRLRSGRRCDEFHASPRAHRRAGVDRAARRPRDAGRRVTPSSSATAPGSCSSRSSTASAGAGSRSSAGDPRPRSCSATACVEVDGALPAGVPLDRGHARRARGAARRRTARRRCPICRRCTAGSSAISATTSSARSSTCRDVPRDDRRLPDAVMSRDRRRWPRSTTGASGST